MLFATKDKKLLEELAKENWSESKPGLFCCNVWELYGDFESKLRLQ